MRIENDILTKSGRFIVPTSLRPHVLEKVHGVAHFGVEKNICAAKRSILLAEYVWVYKDFRRIVQGLSKNQMFVSATQSTSGTYVDPYETDGVCCDGHSLYA